MELDIAREIAPSVLGPLGALALALCILGLIAAFVWRKVWPLIEEVARGWLAKQTITMDAFVARLDSGEDRAIAAEERFVSAEARAEERHRQLMDRFAGVCRHTPPSPPNSIH